jgi:hypothetical protein
MSLHQKQCLNHHQREAVARCPQCAQFYCRECITEHDDRVICAACLKKLLRADTEKPRPLALLGRAAAFSFSLLIAWTAFYWIGRILLAIPTNFHDGTLWKTTFWQE